MKTPKTPEELGNSIEFDVVLPTKSRPFYTVKANLLLSAHAKATDTEVNESNFNLIDHIKSGLREQILRSIFADQRKTIHEAIMDLATTDPFSSTFYEKREKLMAIARRGGAEL